VVAEGVETVSQMEVLFNLGCHICQGFLFARPMPGAQVETWVQEIQSGLVLPRLQSTDSPTASTESSAA